jgi:CHAT domain-containing protein/tetratricopeptide (TPR) repeat protein
LAKLSACDEIGAELADELRGLFAHCRQVGVDRAVSEWARRERALDLAFRNFITIGGYDLLEKVVLETPSLLRVRILSALEGLIDRSPSEEGRRFLQSRRNLLLRCREVGIEQAFAEAARRDADALLQAVQTFLDTNTWDEALAILRQHPPLLDVRFGADLEELVRRRTGESKPLLDDVAGLRLEERFLLLARCREVGIDQAHEEMRSQIVFFHMPDVTLEAALDVLVWGDDGALKGLLTKYPQLLAPRMDRLLRSLSMRQTNEEARIALGLRRARLARCRQVGSTAGLDEPWPAGINLPVRDRFRPYREQMAALVKASPGDLLSVELLAKVRPILEAGLAAPKDPMEELRSRWVALRSMIREEEVLAAIREYPELLAWMEVRRSQFACIDMPSDCTTPPGFEVEYAALEELEDDRDAQGPRNEARIRLCTAVLGRLPEGVHEHFRGLVYWWLGDALARQIDSATRRPLLAEAVECYRRALDFYTEDVPLHHATLLARLGHAHADLSERSRAVECYQEGFRFASRAAHPALYAEIQMALGDTFFLLTPASGAVDPGEPELALAVEHYRQAADTFATLYEGKVYTEQYIKARNGQGRCHFLLGDWAGALEAYRAAADRGQRWYGALLPADFLRQSRVERVGHFAQSYQQAAYCHAQLGRPTEALLALERGKTRVLGESLGLLGRRPASVPESTWQQWQEAAAAMRRFWPSRGRQGGEEDFRQRWDRTERDVRALYEAALDEVRRYDAGFLRDPDWSDIQALLPGSDTALVTWCITSRGSVAFVVHRDFGPAPDVVPMPAFTSADVDRILFGTDRDGYRVASWLLGMIQNPGEGTDTTPEPSDGWRATMVQSLEEIGRRLLCPVFSALPDSVTRVILVPSRGLHLLPLHAAPLPGRAAWLGDRYEVSYGPSLKVLRDSRRKQNTSPSRSLYAVVNPEEDSRLAFARVEGARVAGLFAEGAVHAGRTATQAAAKAGVPGHGYVHICCHGAYDWHDPLNSSLALADGPLTLGRLLDGCVDLSAASLVTLSACETGLTHAFTRSADEYVGLPAGFLLAGVPCVVSSLWTVPDLSTALLMMRFYANHLEGGQSVAASLRQAQQWVRRLTCAEVAAEAARCREAARGQREEPTLFHCWRHYQARARRDPGERPFAHPYFWAAFTVNGA